jgi:hypothetical protein
MKLKRGQGSHLIFKKQPWRSAPRTTTKWTKGTSTAESSVGAYTRHLWTLLRTNIFLVLLSQGNDVVICTDSLYMVGIKSIPSKKSIKKTKKGYHIMSINYSWFLYVVLRSRKAELHVFNSYFAACGFNYF